jgi:GTPase
MATRCGTVVLAGLPNVGKSSLLNALVGERLAIVSPKAQSTRVPVVGVLTRGDDQFIFTDPPGLLTPSYKLQERMREAALRAIADAEVIAYLHPLPDAPAPSFVAAAGLSAAPQAPVVAVYTKADLVPPERRPAPLAGIAVSSATGEGMDALLDTLAGCLPGGPFHYPTDEMATQPLRFFASEYVREAAFAVLEEELPYSVACEIDEFRESETPTYIRATVYVERDSQKGIVIGHQGRTIKAIGQAARARIEGLTGGPVYLDLNVKVLDNWRRQEGLLRRLGYTT